MSHSKNTINDFWNKINIKDKDECWEWFGGKNRDGYGVMRWDGRSDLSNRISWRVHFGDIPEGMCVCHTCDNPSCVNPNHLFLASSIDNTKDRHTKHRDASGEQHGRSKITDSDARRILELRSYGYTITELGRLFGIDHTMISRICRRKNWVHISC